MAKNESRVAVEIETAALLEITIARADLTRIDCELAGMEADGKYHPDAFFELARETKGISERLQALKTKTRGNVPEVAETGATAKETALAKLVLAVKDYKETQTTKDARDDVDKATAIGWCGVNDSIWLLYADKNGRGPYDPAKVAPTSPEMLQAVGDLILANCIHLGQLLEDAGLPETFIYHLGCVQLPQGTPPPLVAAWLSAVGQLLIRNSVVTTEEFKLNTRGAGFELWNGGGVVYFSTELLEIAKDGRIRPAHGAGTLSLQLHGGDFQDALKLLEKTYPGKSPPFVWHLPEGLK